MRDRPFDPRVVERAKSLADRYPVTVRRDGQGYVGTVAELPAVFGCGATSESALTATRDLLTWALAYLIEAGRDPAPKA